MAGLSGQRSKQRTAILSETAMLQSNVLAGRKTRSRASSRELEKIFAAVPPSCGGDEVLRTYAMSTVLSIEAEIVSGI